MNYEFVDSKIPTKYGVFCIRIYAANQGQETVVLWTENLNLELPVLVRAHSECLTGDLLDSLLCDCGKQLARSLQQIQEEGGVFIYLRQEGRGIGLFEKIKAYKLQSEGHDTVEANILLGHLPDERSYEMVLIVLNDLRIKRIRLLTNNPNKVSEIAKLGIEVVERVPIIIRPNKYNKKYFTIKREKFNHCFDKNISTYFYQFHAENPEQVKEIGEYLKDAPLDPLLRVYVGISANPSIMLNENEITRIISICHACHSYKHLTPILHFSFQNSKNPDKDIIAIKELLPIIQHLQMNDLSFSKSLIEHACQLFTCYIPLSDENFQHIHNKDIRREIKNHNAFLLLDNSKGRGIQETKESLMKKIDTLLNYGLNDIGICGGFGPNDLETYFELRRFYKLNFSIDSETKLKTNGIFDIEKIKLYLFQLLRFDDPKFKGIEQTRAFYKQHQRTDWDKITIENHEFSIHPKVFHAGYFPSTLWFAEKVKQQVKNHLNFCEVGCGSGIISCLVAIDNPQMQVISTDISIFASENTKLNADRLGLGKRIQVTNGDVFDGMIPGNRFDSIFWALPFGYLDPGVMLNFEEMQVFDPGYRAIRKFFQTAKKFIKPNGKLLIGFSSDLGHAELLEKITKTYNLKLYKSDEKQMLEKEPIKFELLIGTYE